jgi:ABC-type glycerol-3-phosphate transport system substrate-binding protein
MINRRLLLASSAVLLFLIAWHPGVGAQTTPLQIWVTSETDAKYYQQMAELYAKTAGHASFRADVRAYGHTEMPDKLAVAIKTGVNAPDVVQLDEIFFSLYLRGEVPFVDLTTRVRAAGLDKKIVPQRSRLFEYGGRVYGVPQSLSGIVLYYREDLFAEAKITPASIDTWEKFRTVGRTIRASSDRGLLALDWSYFEILLRQRGYDIYDASGKVTLDTPVAANTLEWLIQLKNDGVAVQPDRGTIFESAFFSGDVAAGEIMCIIGADWYGLDMIQHMAPTQSGQWRAMPLPVWTDAASRGKSTTSSFAGEGLLVYKGSKRVDDAWGFIQFVMESVEANVQRYLQGNSLTAYAPAWTDPRLHKPEPYFGGQSVAELLMTLAPQLPTVYASPHKAQLVNLWREKYWTAVMRGAIPPRTALAEIQAELK